MFILSSDARVPRPHVVRLDDRFDQDFHEFVSPNDCG